MANNQDPMPFKELIAVLQDTNKFLARTENDYSWSSWQNASSACGEIDEIVANLQAGQLPKRASLTVLFAPTGPIQEVSLSSGWGKEFLMLSDQFDAALSRTTDSESPTAGEI